MNILTPWSLLRKIKVWINNTFIAERGGIDFVAGSNITIAASEDATTDRVLVTINASSGGGGTTNAYSQVTDGTNTASASGASVLRFRSPNSTINVTVSDGTPDTVDLTVGNHTHNASDITSGRLSADRLPTDSNTDRFLAVRTANATPVYTQIQASDVVSGRFALGRMPTSATANRFLVVRTANADPTYDTIQASDLPNHTHTRSQITDFAHQATHQAGGSDALTGNLDAIARTTVRVNTGSDIGARRRLNFIAGSNVTINATDDPTNEEVDITISASGGSGSYPDIDYHHVVLDTSAPMVNSNTYYTAVSVSLGRGVWVLYGQIQFQRTTMGDRTYKARLWNSTDSQGISEAFCYVPSANPSSAVITIIGVLSNTTTSNKTVALQGQTSEGSSSDVIEANYPESGRGSTHLIAIRVNDLN